MRAILRRFFDDKNVDRIMELIRYGLVGLSTTIINIAVYQGLLFVLDYKIANIIALVASKTYGYLANKNIVFRSRTDSFTAFLRELMRFIFARGFTAVVDYFGLIMAVELFGFDKVISKYVIQVIVIILNYVLGKFMVFKKADLSMEDLMVDTEVQKYNTGNLDKYRSGNSLKQKMIANLHGKMLDRCKDLTGDGKCRILDAGCGEGFFCSKLREAFPDADITGCDGAAEALEIARNMNPGVSFEEANLYELPYDNNEFDLVVCSEVLEHLNDPGKAFKELCRVGKGVLITVPHEPWFRLGNLMTLHNVTRLGDPVDHINHWTYGGFKRFIAPMTETDDHGFDRSFPWSIFWIKL